MKVIATNIGKKETHLWNGKSLATGIFKYPEEGGIFLAAHDVHSDSVVDRKHHGGIDKACYAYSADFYAHWKKQYPDLDWDYGMFGENLTISGLNEKEISIGDIFKIGNARIQVAQPRQPCSKLNLRFQSNQMVKKFVAFGYSGIYFRVLEDGKVAPKDTLELLQKGTPFLSVYDAFRVILKKEKDAALKALTLQHPDLAESAKAEI